MSDEEFECQKCHASVQLGDGLIPTKYCNLCAQELVESMSDRLQAVERDNGLLKEQIRVADVAYQSLHERHQAVEKSHTALRLASEELIACVRHGDQEDIGEAMGKIESILQPAQKEQL